MNIKTRGQGLIRHIMGHTTITKKQYRRHIIHHIICIGLLCLTFFLSATGSLNAIWVGIMTISYIPFIIIDSYQKNINHIYTYGLGGITLYWLILSTVQHHAIINVGRSIAIWILGWQTRIYCRTSRIRNHRSIFNQISTIGVFVISIIFALLTMRRFQSINFSCVDLNFLPHNIISVIGTTQTGQLQQSPIVTGGREQYINLLDQRLTVQSGDNSLNNTIKTQLRNSVVIVMDQKKLYDKSICDYVTTALHNNYQKPSFFYSGILLLVFIGLPAARLALLIIATIYSCILRTLHRFGIYQTHISLIEHEYFG